MGATFATFGLPELFVTDNGSSFMSSEFAQFVKQNRIRQHHRIIVLQTGWPNVRSKPLKMCGRIEEVRGTVSCTVQLEDGRNQRHHVDHLRTQG